MRGVRRSAPGSPPRSITSPTRTSPRWDERCPHCSAAIRVSRPRHGGTAISEILPSGRLIPHPCFDRLRGKRAGRETLDLFFDWSPG